MNRQIIFRGKRFDNSEWIVGDLVENQGRFFIYHATSETTIEDNDDCKIAVIAVEVNPATVGQFTGLLDKNGKEIYEGDRVNVVQAERNFDIVVKWSNEAMAFMACYADGKQSPFSWFTNLQVYQLTVIGNIYDNPSLISDKQ